MLTPILPEIILFCSALFILMIDVFFNKKNEEFFRISYLLAIVACFVTLYFIARNIFVSGHFFSNMFALGSFTCFVKFVSVALLIFILVLSLGYLAQRNKISAEFIALLMISTVGGMLLISANDFLTFYLALELQALPLYLLAAINRDSKKSSESGMKYFILGSTASGLILLGISFFYGFSGTTNFAQATQLYLANPAPPAVVLGFILIVTGMFFKISAAPFHMWTPDVYEGSDTIVTTFFATIIKFTSVLVLVRLFLEVSNGWIGVDKVLIAVAIASMLVGSFGAIKQTNFKRLLAYSSIGHVGFVILSLSSLSLEGVKACVFYMFIYACLALGSFGFLSLIFGLKKSDANLTEDQTHDKIYDISSFAGLSKTNPIMAFFLAVLMFSTAGIPPLAGFFSKFYVISAVAKSGHIIPAVLAVLFSVISAYYYLRIVKIMYFDAPNENQVEFIDRYNPKFVIGFLVAFNLLFVFCLNAVYSTIGTMLGF